MKRAQKNVEKEQSREQEEEGAQKPVGISVVYITKQKMQASGWLPKGHFGTDLTGEVPVARICRDWSTRSNHNPRAFRQESRSKQR